MRHVACNLISTKWWKNGIAINDTFRNNVQKYCPVKLRPLWNKMYLESFQMNDKRKRMKLYTAKHYKFYMVSDECSRNDNLNIKWGCINECFFLFCCNEAKLYKTRINVLLCFLTVSEVRVILLVVLTFLFIVKG